MTWQSHKKVVFLQRKPYLRNSMNAQVTHSIREYFKTQPVEKAWIFGSFSRNEEQPNSDVDILVKLTSDARMGLKFVAMMCDLEDILKRPVDIVREGCILPYAQASIDKDKVLIYERAC